MYGFELENLNKENMGMINKIMNKLFFSCQHATELVEKKNIVPLSLLEKIRFNAHMMICSACRSYQRQSVLLEKMFHRLNDTMPLEENVPKMDATSKTTVLDKLRESK